ncbi:hypothetical protein [Secundilactobacillus similis]|uniref:hypothetical protein n=1 Tax=Secundilactobacillus similis TaxID=414682 RepID=UPI0012E3B601|nr:hypothetical protein [Secundilactobacillus similis]
MSEKHQQPPIIATQHPPSRLPESYIDDAERSYRRASQNALNSNVILSNQHKRDDEVQHRSIVDSLQLLGMTTIISAVDELPFNIAITQFRQLQNVTASCSVTDSAPCSGRRRRAELSSVGMT